MKSKARSTLIQGSINISIVNDQAYFLEKTSSSCLYLDGATIDSALALDRPRGLRLRRTPFSFPWDVVFLINPHFY